MKATHAASCFARYGVSGLYAGTPTAPTTLPSSSTKSSLGTTRGWRSLPATPRTHAPKSSRLRARPDRPPSSVTPKRILPPRKLSRADRSRASRSGGAPSRWNATRAFSPAASRPSSSVLFMSPPRHPLLAAAACGGGLRRPSGRPRHPAPSIRTAHTRRRPHLPGATRARRCSPPPHRLSPGIDEPA